MVSAAKMRGLETDAVEDVARNMKNKQTKKDDSRLII